MPVMLPTNLSNPLTLNGLIILPFAIISFIYI
jgi:hypothetical protein